MRGERRGAEGREGTPCDTPTVALAYSNARLQYAQRKHLTSDCKPATIYVHIVVNTLSTHCCAILHVHTDVNTKYTGVQTPKCTRLSTQATPRKYRSPTSVLVRKPLSLTPPNPNP